MLSACLQQPSHSLHDERVRQVHGFASARDGHTPRRLAWEAIRTSQAFLRPSPSVPNEVAAAAGGAASAVDWPSKPASPCSAFGGGSRAPGSVLTPENGETSAAAPSAPLREVDGPAPAPADADGGAVRMGRRETRMLTLT
jgi:hypothetical protein